ncbi:hypothetical protein C0J52_17119 [Blattella germanica]|nr:hypothetical protein C0J52_17119 [Blattella germanica]
MANFKVLVFVILLCLLLMAELGTSKLLVRCDVHLQDTDDPCAIVRCMGGYDCVANYEGCESDDIHNCTAKPECVKRSTTGELPERETTVHSCTEVTCNADQDCLESYVDCVSYPCEPTVKCIPRVFADVEFADDTGNFKACNLLCIIGNRCIIKDGKAQCVPYTTTETPPTTPASSWKDPCKTTVCNDGEQCYSIYHTCETGICFPTPVCVPVFQEAEVDASSWEDPCNLVDCRDGAQCYPVYHTCETGTCPPTPVCVPPFEEAEDDVSDTPPVTPAASSWEDPCNLKECKDDERCIIQAHTCDTDTEIQQCTEFGDAGKLCEADCLESEECRCINPPGIFCFVGPCLFPTCIDKNTYGNTLDNTITDTTVTDEN